VTARHGAERISEGLPVAAGGLLLDASTAGKKNHDLFLVGYGVAAGGGMLAFSRKHESEADYIGIRYAAKAGYDPRAAISFWKKMIAENDKPKGRLSSFFLGLLSTHPLTTNRLVDLQQWMPETLPLYEAAKRKYQN
jgi:predicted Zn-dependent protease